MSPAATTARSRFIALLRDNILQVDASDLDFGICRVPNHHRARIGWFLPDGLRARVCVEPCAPTN